jgi:hypothetical protein
MNKEEKLDKIIEILDSHIRGAGDLSGVRVRTDSCLEKYIYPHLKPNWFVLDVCRRLLYRRSS